MILSRGCTWSAHRRMELAMFRKTAKHCIRPLKRADRTLQVSSLGSRGRGNTALRGELIIHSWDRAKGPVGLL